MTPQMGDKVVASLESLQASESVSYLTQQQAAEVDEELMGPLGFSVDQLMVYYTFYLLFKISKFSILRSSNLCNSICAR